MTNKEVLLDCIAYPTTFPTYSTDGLECADQLMDIKFKTFRVGNTRWFVFRPTTSLWNWVVNFVFPKKIIPYGNKDSKIRIHSGFMADYLSVRDWVHYMMQFNDAEKYVFCGHSLGGALARLAAVDVQYTFNKDVFVCTIGAPNIGNKAFEDSFSKRIPNTVYYTIQHDPVPLVPTKLLGYTLYTRTLLSDKYKVRFWLNHLPEVYIDRLNSIDATKEDL